ncbi:polyisoprenoid-binding protein YceI [Mucilaginibacter frigoritolerans]|uniref:Polyisoprenoid-binding protein YceI n=1 Tax=Mucilaginibacter frigoritolerans TaxID=652788 RepID=A0A562TV33_9SPHI|nr:YceI family protein [Mucilaginibacter frigoritolerans]TWI96650.1 polyisoprenoid-binding protein YceI [Mucilaginibacter frigoritolerans]
MKKLSAIVVVGASALLFSFTTITPSVWTADKAHARITFTITHNMLSDVEGSFKLFDATISAPSDDFAGSTIVFTADAASISTDNDYRDKEVKSSELLDVEKFPKITFRSTSVTKTSASTYKIVGDLTLHGVTKQVILDAYVRTGIGMHNKPGAGFKISGTINRIDFGITKYPAAMLGDEITLNANGEFDKD